ncbi:MAG: hypothetical protein NTV07_04480, partial [Candidatus Omnitrophica bacterium]|nr:hypothetical protein [Candidatus Omnitrophota bacterium]
HIVKTVQIAGVKPATETKTNIEMQEGVSAGAIEVKTDEGVIPLESAQEQSEAPTREELIQQALDKLEKGE